MAYLTSKSGWVRGLSMATVFLAVGAMPLQAGPLADAAAKAEALAASGDSIGAHNAMQAAIGDFSATAPFAIGKAVFVKSDPGGYGMYEPREKPEFKIGEALVSYVEPVGLSWKPADVPAKMTTNFTVDFDILDSKGTVLASQKEFGKFSFTSFLRNQEIYSTITIDVTGAPAGDYVLRLHFNDTNDAKSATVDQPFTVVAS